MIGLAGLTVIATLLGKVYLPIWDHNTELKQKLEGQIHDMVVLEQKLNLLKDTEEKNQLALLKLALPGERQFEAVFYELYSIFEKNGVTLISVQTYEPKDKDGLYALPIAISMQGCYLGVLDSFEEVENMERITQIKNFNLSTSRPGGHHPMSPYVGEDLTVGNKELSSTVHATVSLEIYWHNWGNDDTEGMPVSQKVGRKNPFQHYYDD